jgi:DNA-binding transcriptional regulator YiaG
LPKEHATTTTTIITTTTTTRTTMTTTEEGGKKKKNTETLKHKIENNREHTNCQWIKKIRKSTKHSYYTDR